MKTLFVMVMLAATTLLTGCGTSAVIQSEYHLPPGEKLKPEIIQPKATGDGGITDEAVAIFKNRLVSQLANSNLLASSDDGEVRTLEVNITNYRMRSGGARFFGGIFAGKDNIQSTVSIKNAANGLVLMQFTVESNNSTGWGTSQGLIEDHANEIVEILNKAKDGAIGTKDS
jgi:hypothetical protein